MRQSGVIPRALVRLVVIVGAIWAASSGGYHLLWLLLVPPLAWDMFRVFKPGAGRRPAEKFTEPGRHRVVLQVPGTRSILVIRQIQVTTGLGLAEAKHIVDDYPAVVIEGLSEESAELVADRLRAAGAKALAAPIGEM